MKRFFIECAWIVGALLLIPAQTLLTTLLWPPLGSLDCILLTALVLSFRHLPGRAIEVALASSILMDLQSALPFGIFITTMAVTLTFLHFLQRLILKQEYAYAYILITIFVTIVSKSFFYLFVFIVEKFQSTMMYVIQWKIVIQNIGVQLLLQCAMIIIGMILLQRGKNLMFIRARRTQQ